MKFDKKLYGGDFEYYALSKPKSKFEDFFKLKNNHMFFSSGSNALSFVFRNEKLKDKKILIPNYCCWSTILPIIKENNCNIDFYKVNDDFSLEIPKKAYADAIIIINFFGINDYNKIGLEIRRKNPDICIILDNVQALFELQNNGANGKWANWQIYSFRKFLASPGGGLALNIKKSFKLRKAVSTNYDNIWKKASNLKKSFLEGEIKIKEESYLKAFRNSSNLLRNNIKTNISKLSFEQINRQELNIISYRRKKNYKFLYKNLKKFSEKKFNLFELKNKKTPLFFPIILKKSYREKCLNELKLKNLFCAVHWPLINFKFKIKLPKFNDNIISIPIDQRYGEQDMLKILKILKETL